MQQNLLQSPKPNPQPIQPAEAVAAILATLAPLHSAESIAAHCCTSPFRARLVVMVQRRANCSRMLALAALRQAGILP